MIDKDDKDGRHLAETRLEELMKKLHIDTSRVSVSHKCTRWNATMILLTAFLSSLSIIPYTHINREGSNLSHFSQWTFPILRAVGGFLTASMMTLVLQRRISRLTASRLAELNTSEKPDATGPGNDPRQVTGDKSNTERPPVVDGAPREQRVIGMKSLRSTVQHASRDGRTEDIEKALGITEVPSNTVPAKSAGDGKSTTTGNNIVQSPSSPLHHTSIDPHGVLDWVFLGLLLAGILSSVVGYVGCFSVVQNAKCEITYWASQLVSSRQQSATWVVLAWCKKRNHVLGLSAGCAWNLGCRLSE
jgi:uncharacterized membrane protein YraQ (UPF0718 family)